MNEKLAFLPFHAINEFMRDDFRLSVINSVFKNMDNLSDTTYHKLNAQINKSVKIPGFRNPSKAPSTVKLIPTVRAFQKNPDLVAAILSAWMEGKLVLRDEVYEMLKVRKWPFFPDKFEIKDMFNDWRILPINADRTKLPGFYTNWPKGENFDILYQAYMDLYPDSDNSIDSISLMVVWITMRLPYHVEDESILEHDNIE
jgi:hypothetical protein